ncbi:MAG: isoleucine--tRNA ligase [candidate division WOR-3 bacterium]|nr:isoleucine--tRNA ligase [candidate division WOR-3 bacterium]
MKIPVPVPDFPAIEKEILKFWEEKKIFEKLRTKNKGNKKFSFLDGPITANNPMGVHHAWGRTYKDLFQRYKAMLGYDQRYQNGFDCQGLWVEVEVERELGFNSKRDIENYGIANFVNKCKERVLKYSKIQTQQSIRLGQWMDWDNSYYTMSDENNYTIWYFLKECHKHNWIYKGHDVMPWCPRCGTALSEHEIVTEGYKELTHPAIYLKFPIKGKDREYLLVWTTTPWTLSSNVACAVHPDLYYVKVKADTDIYYLIKSRIEVINGKYQILDEFLGKELLEMEYIGPYDELPAQKDVVHKVIPWDEVSGTEGTGIVHIAPGCGKEDFELGKEFNLPAIAPLTEDGYFLNNFGFLTGKNVKDSAQLIFDDLQKKGMVYKIEDYTHRYPVCWRCDSEVIFRLVDEWFISMDELRYKIMDSARQVRWIPEFGLERELDWLRNMQDWCISKKRYWGLALPIYDCQCGKFEVIGGKEELKERAVRGWEKFEGNSPHRPWIDEVKIRCNYCGQEISRILDVGNPWLDAGIVPFSTLHYLTDRKYWEQWFPADFITECFPGQFRNWFYAILAMSTVLENRAPFKTLLGHALVKDEYGEEMHKSKGNVIWFDEAAEKMGADIMRWIFTNHNPQENLHFGYQAAYETKRKLLTLWNIYSFFVNYARIDQPKLRLLSEHKDTDTFAGLPLTVLDQWILSRLNYVVQKVREHLDDFDPAPVPKIIDEFIDDLSSWYVRRNRRRFWKPGKDDDKLAAYQTLYECLVTLIKLIAPIMPFLSETIYQNIVRSIDPQAPESVHLNSFPEPKLTFYNPQLEREMALVRELISLGLSARKAGALKVRQPLPTIAIIGLNSEEKESLKKYFWLIQDELNIKSIEIFESEETFNLLRDNKNYLFSSKSEIEQTPKSKYKVAINKELTQELIEEGLARELVHKIQNLRKTAGFDIIDRIEFYYSATEKLGAAIKTFEDYICQEVLAVTIQPIKSDLANKEDFEIAGETLKVNQETVTVYLKRVPR